MERSQYTLRGIPDELDARLREEARVRGISLNALLVETLQKTMLDPPSLRENLAWFIGSGDGLDAAEEDALRWLDTVPGDLP